MIEEDRKTERRRQVEMVKKLAKSSDNRRGAFLPGLWAARAAAALSQRALAERVGTNQGTIHELESLARGAYPSTVKKLSVALDVEPADLLCEEATEDEER
jgi:ribosome-binding protein aMBF1 (putative translation factor)